MRTLSVLAILTMALPTVAHANALDGIAIAPETNAPEYHRGLYDHCIPDLELKDRWSLWSIA